MKSFCRNNLVFHSLNITVATMSDSPILDVETAKAALTEILEALESHEQAPKLKQAKKNSGNDMLKSMQYVFPILVQIQMDVIKKYGFTDDRKGIIQFAQEIQSLEQEDQTIMDLHGQIRTNFLPPVNITNEALL